MIGAIHGCVLSHQDARSDHRDETEGATVVIHRTAPHLHLILRQRRILVVHQRLQRNTFQAHEEKEEGDMDDRLPPRRCQSFCGHRHRHHLNADILQFQEDRHRQQNARKNALQSHLLARSANRIDQHRQLKENEFRRQPDHVRRVTVVPIEIINANEALLDQAHRIPVLRQIHHIHPAATALEIRHPHLAARHETKMLQNEKPLLIKR